MPSLNLFHSPLPDYSVSCYAQCIAHYFEDCFYLCYIYEYTIEFYDMLRYHITKHHTTPHNTTPHTITSHHMTSHDITWQHTTHRCMDALGREAFSEAYRYLKLFEEVSNTIHHCSHDYAPLLLYVCVSSPRTYNYNWVTIELFVDFSIIIINFFILLPLSIKSFILLNFIL